MQTVNGERFSIEGGIKWRGAGYERLERLPKNELIAYIKKLETALYLVHSHFWFGDIETIPGESVHIGAVGCDYDWKAMSVPLTTACLEMYKMHNTEFRPVPMPDKKKKA